MRVHVLYFGVLKDIVGWASEQMELPEGSTVAAAISTARSRGDAPMTLWNSLACAVNRVYSRPDVVLRDGDELALLPPVSGGALWEARSTLRDRHAR